MLFIILKDSMCIARRALNGVDGVLSVVFLPYPNSVKKWQDAGESLELYPPGGIRNSG